MRDVPGSSYNGMMILSSEQIHSLAAEGWGVSCHGMTHRQITDENAAHEVADARRMLEEKIDMPVRLFCVPGNNSSYPPVLKVARDAGYSAIMTVYDDVNTMDSDLFRLCRCPLHTQYRAPYFSAYDPYKRIHQAIECGGWIIDYCPCPMPGKPIHPHKDCTLDELGKRFEAVRRLGGKDVWLAEPNEVVAYMRDTVPCPHDPRSTE